MIEWLYAEFHAQATYPQALALLVLAIPAWYWSRQAAGRVVFSSLRALPAGGHTWRTRLAWLPDALIVGAVIALVIAMTGPRAGDKNARIRREGIAIAMAVDVSGSMRALDLSDKTEQTRLDAVRHVFEQFVLGGGGLDGRTDDMIGLVAFARYAETRSPLTLDHRNLAKAAEQLDFARAGDDGTAIGAGLELAVQRLAENKARSKVVVLLTDGESNVHDIDEDTAIDDAVKAGITVYTIGAGTTGVAPIRDENGTLMGMPVSIDENLLRKIAEKTGGQYFRAKDAAGLRAIYRQIDKLQRTEFEQEQFLEYNLYYTYFVVGALGLLAAALVLRGTVLRRLP